MEDEDKIFENSAKMSIEIFDLKKKTIKLEFDIKITQEKLISSEDAYKSIIKKAHNTIDTMKNQFSKILQLLKNNE